MNKKAAMKLKKQMMVLWSVVGACCFILLVITILSLFGVIKGGFSPISGIFIPALILIAAVAQVVTYFKETKITYELATNDEKNAIFDIFERAKKALRDKGIDQWDDEYPNINDIARDIKEESMTKVIVNKKIVAVYTLNDKQDPSYNFGEFDDKGGNYRILHRFCIDPEFWQIGYAPKIMEYVETKAKKEGITSIRLDVFSKNPRAVMIYELGGYKYAGDAYYRKGKFYLMEKVLHQ